MCANIEWGGSANYGWGVGVTFILQAGMAQGIIGRGTRPGDEARRWTNIKCHGRERRKGRKSGWDVSVCVFGFPFAEVRHVRVVVKIVM
jgi:hypothetical protein